MYKNRIGGIGKCSRADRPTRQNVIKKSLERGRCAEEEGMPFDVISSWIAAGALTLFMVVMGLRNQRLGWKRERQDVVLDSLTLWATTVAKPAPPVQPAVQASVSLTSDLAALHMALGTATPVSAPVQDPRNGPTFVRLFRLADIFDNSDCTRSRRLRHAPRSD